MKKLASIVAVAAVIAFAIALAGCSGGASSSTPPASSTGGSSGSAPAAGATAVTISNFAFSPAEITVKVGDTVTWTNQDSVGHTVTSDDGSFASQNPIAQGGTYSFKFAKAGTYTYHCAVHPSMTAKVTVQ